MKSPTRTLFTAGAAALVAVFAFPSVSTPFALLGFQLGVTKSLSGFQRDVRVFNNAADFQANNDQTADPAFPGALGAAKAIWLGSAEWDSNDVDAARNFDFNWQGAAGSAGGSNDNVVSWGTSGCGGGTLAFTQSPGSNGWKIQFCEQEAWDDLANGSGFDIAGIMTHEYGHALGLGHTSVGCSGSCAAASTMCPFVCGDGSQARSIEPDDANGLQAIYGGIPAGKPEIDMVAGNFAPGGKVTLVGSGFDGTVDVKFTAGTSTNTGAIPGVVFNQSTSTNGLANLVSVTVPGNAQRGAVQIWEGSARLSNWAPFDTTQGCTTDSYGTAEVGSTGQLATIGTNGNPSPGNPNFAIIGSGFKPNQFAVLFHANGIGSNPSVWGEIIVGGTGLLRDYTTSNGSGNVSVAFSVTPAMVGTTRFYQWAVRDPGFGGNVQASGGLMVTFCP